MNPTTLRIKFKALLVYKALYHLRPTSFPVSFPATLPYHSHHHQLTLQLSPNSSTLAFLHFLEKSQTDSCPRVFALVFPLLEMLHMLAWLAPYHSGLFILKCYLRKSLPRDLCKRTTKPTTTTLYPVELFYSQHFDNI